MKVINNFLFCNRKWHDTEKTTPCAINIDKISLIDVNCVDGVETIVLQTVDGQFLIAEPIEDFFIEFAKLIKNEMCFLD